MTDPTDDAPAPGSAGQAPPPRTAVKEHVNVLTFGLLLAAGAVGALMTLLAAYDVRPFGGTSTPLVLGYPIVFVAHLLVGALIVGGIVDLRRHTDLFNATGRVVMGVITLLAMATLVIAFRQLRPLLDVTGQTVTYLVAAGLGALVGGLLSYLVLSRKQLTKGNQQFVAIQAAAVLGGFSAGVVGLVVLIIGLSVVRYWTLPPATFGSTTVDGITGTYVALGDSYSAGEGIRPFDPNTGPIDDYEGDDCHRSGQAYSGWLAFDGPIRPLRFAACSGAVSPDIYTGFARTRSDGSQVPVAPQVDSDGTDPPTPHPEVGLVTITIGGNDVLFSSIVVHCLEYDQCMSATFTPPAEPPPPTSADKNDVGDAAAETANKITFPPAQPLGTWAPAALEMVSERLSELYPKLKASYPNARIVVIGYPQLFPGSSPGLIPTDCASLLRRFSDGERSQLRALTDQFNDVLYERTVEAGIEFVSPAAVWKGHEPCGDKGQFTNGVKLLVAPNVVDGGSFHPNTNGQHALAALLACYLDINPQPPNPYVDDNAHPITAEGLQTPAELGLVPAPGSMDAPLSCDAVG